MSGWGQKHSMSNCRSTDRDGAPPKCNTSQHRRPEESPQGATREIMYLTQEDIPRIIEGVIKSLARWDWFTKRINIQQSCSYSYVLLPLLLYPPLLLWPLIPPATPCLILMVPLLYIPTMPKLSYLLYVSCIAIYI